MYCRDSSGLKSMMSGNIDPEYCAHTELTDDVCLECGRNFSSLHDLPVEIVADRKRCAADNSHQIFKDVVVEDDVKSVAINIYKNYPNRPTRDSKKRQKVIYYCLVSAYQQLKKPYSSNAIAKTVGLDPKDISKAMIKGLKVSTVSAAVDAHTAQELVPLYYKMYNETSDDQEYAVLLCNRLLEKNPKLSRVNPYLLAAAVVYYYFQTIGQQPKLHDFATKVGQSEDRLSIQIDRVQKIDNS